jgi:hypothetical protein
MLAKSAGKFRMPCVYVASNDLEILHWIRTTVGLGRIVKKPQKLPHHRESYAWELKGPRAVDVLAAVAARLLVPKKRRRAELIVRDYRALTRRNGGYSDDERAAKFAFEAAFFAL